MNTSTFTGKEESSRFAFGRNWQRYLRDISENRRREARASLESMLGAVDLRSTTFIDVGSGSGLFSLAARDLGATVHSFDYDENSVRCTESVKEMFRPGDDGWKIERGSILDEPYVQRLGKFDVVYSWGVLHHTGAMWNAMENAASLVADGGLLYIAIYNDQGKASQRWTKIKRTYNRSPRWIRAALLALFFVRLRVLFFVKAILSGKLMEARARRGRGMSQWFDLVDWVGGYPFEVARPEEIFEFYRERGFQLERLKTCGGGLGCNELVFRKIRYRA